MSRPLLRPKIARDPPRIDGERRLESALDVPACPLCLSGQGAETHWLETFLDEGLHTPEMLRGVTAGPGFCGRHGARLAALESHEAAIAQVHVAILRRVVERLAGTIQTGRIDSRSGLACAACAHHDEVSRRDAFLLASALRGRGVGRYGDPALLCGPHLALMADRLDAGTAHAISIAHEKYLDQPLPEQMRSDALERSVARLLGEPRDGIRERDGVLETGAGELDAWARVRDPIARFRARLSDDTECALCVELHHVQTTWLRWLREHATASGSIEDVLPACADHVWLAFRFGDVALQRRLAEQALHRERMRFKHLRRAWANEFSAHLLASLPGLRAHRPAPRSIRTHLSARPPCVLCDHLSTVHRRSVALLGILLGESPTHRAIEQGFGLCARHALPALGMIGPDAARTLAAVLRVKFECAIWELEEMLRKSAWTARAEPAGDEALAWRHAISLVCGRMT